MAIRVEGGVEIVPQIVFTNSFLNNAIKFNLDPRFAAQSVLTQVSGAFYYNRGADQFIEVDLNGSQQTFYPINLYSPLYTRDDVNRTIDSSFKELINA
jgi:hypothetical protein